MSQFITVVTDEQNHNYKLSVRIEEILFITEHTDKRAILHLKAFDKENNRIAFKVKNTFAALSKKINQ